MVAGAIGNPPNGLSGRDGSDRLLELGQSERAAILGHLLPGEFVVWAGQGIPRPIRTIPVFPAIFAAILCGSSGFALMVLYGIFGVRKMEWGEMLFLLGLAPAALGCITAVGLSAAWGRHLVWQRQIARSFYAVTDRRALAGFVGRQAGDITIFPWIAGMFDETRLVEHDDGIGSVYFVRCGGVVEPEWAFEGIREAGHVEALIREVVLGEKPPSGAEFQEL